MKKLFLALLAVFSIALVVAGCGGDSKPAANSGDKKVVLKVGATPVPHAEILNLIKPQLAKEGVDLQIIEFSDYVKPNLSLADKELDANFFQHTPYLEKFASERNLPLVAYTKVHIEPMGVYSKKLKDLNNVPSGAKVAIPNDPTNGGRALALLQSAKLLKLLIEYGITGLLLVWFWGWLAVVLVWLGLFVFWGCSHMAKKQFGGITGDLAGFFLVLSETVYLLGAALLGGVLA